MIPSKPQVKIIKSPLTVAGATVQLGPSVLMGRSRALPQSRSSAPSAGTAASPQARVIESTRDYAILEITCSCGQKVTVQCQYAAPAPAT